jgi:hypothetical protein
LKVLFEQVGRSGEVLLGDPGIFVGIVSGPANEILFGAAPLAVVKNCLDLVIALWVDGFWFDDGYVAVGEV